MAFVYILQAKRQGAPLEQDQQVVVSSASLQDFMSVEMSSQNHWQDYYSQPPRSGKGRKLDAF